MSKQWGTHPHRETHTERHSHTLKHSYAHLHAHRHTLLLLFVAQSCANDFQHIYNYCKCVQNFRHYVCVGVKERQRTNTGESESVLHLCASMCVCKVNIRFYRLLLFAGLLQHATRESKNNREGEREREGWGNSVECRCFGHFIRLGHRSQTRK